MSGLFAFLRAARPFLVAISTSIDQLFEFPQRLCHYLSLMTRNRGYKFWLKLTPGRLAIIVQWLGACRALFNLGLRQRELNWHRRKKTSFAEQSAELPALKLEFPFFADVPHHCLQQKLKDLHFAFERLKVGLGGYPNEKKKFKSRDSIRFPDEKQFEVDQTKKISVGRQSGKEKVKGFGRVWLPKIGWLKFRQTRRIPGKIKNITIGIEAGKVFVSFLVEQEISLPAAPEIAIGIDRGCRQMGMTSFGETLEMPVPRMKSIERSIASASRKLARKQKFSKNWVKCKRRLTRLHSQVKNIRHDQANKITTDLAKSHGFIALENLQIENMVASAAGTIEEPGSNVAQKSGLNRSILRQGWGMFGEKLAYKMEERGGRLIKVPPAYTSQTCSVCGHCEAGNRHGEAFKCLACNYCDHADINAAKNILKVGLDIAHAADAALGDSATPAAPTRRKLRIGIRNRRAREGRSPA
jgi:putative transposase